MKPSAQTIGRVVISRQGHDQGKPFLVVGLLDEKHVLIADGETRKMHNPKKKQLKHLEPKPHIAEDILNVIEKKAQTADSDIRKALKTYFSSINSRPQDKEENTFV